MLYIGHTQHGAVALILPQYNVFDLLVVVTLECSACAWQPLLSSMDGDNTQLMHLTASPLHCEDSKHSGGFRGWGGGGGWVVRTGI